MLIISRLNRILDALPPSVSLNAAVYQRPNTPVEGRMTISFVSEENLRSSDRCDDQFNAVFIGWPVDVVQFCSSVFLLHEENTRLGRILCHGLGHQTTQSTHQGTSKNSSQRDRISTFDTDFRIKSSIEHDAMVHLFTRRSMFGSCAKLN